MLETSGDLGNYYMHSKILKIMEFLIVPTVT